MTDLSISNSHAYAVMTAACWAVPALALAWGAIRLRRYLSRPCGARFELSPAAWKTYPCDRPHRHRGAHSGKFSSEPSGRFEWYDAEGRNRAPAT